MSIFNKALLLYTVFAVCQFDSCISRNWNAFQGDSSRSNKKNRQGDAAVPKFRSVNGQNGHRNRNIGRVERCDQFGFCGNVHNFKQRYGDKGIRSYFSAKPNKNNQRKNGPISSYQPTERTILAPISVEALTIPFCNAIRSKMCMLNDSSANRFFFYNSKCSKSLAVSVTASHPLNFIGGRYVLSKDINMDSPLFTQTIGPRAPKMNAEPLRLFEISDTKKCSEGILFGLGQIDQLNETARVFATSSCIQPNIQRTCNFAETEWTLRHSAMNMTVPPEVSVLKYIQNDPQSQCATKKKFNGIRWLHIPKTGTTFGNSILHLVFVSFIFLYLSYFASIESFSLLLFFSCS